MKCLIAFALITLAGLLVLPARAQNLPSGPLVELSRPNAVGNCNTGFNAFGIWPTDEAEEPYVAVNPVRPNNVVAAWIQGPFQDIIAAASFDGGQTWQQAPIPITTCSGGPYPGTGDPWLSFAPNGNLYAIAVSGSTLSSRIILISKSTDGGLHWTSPLVILGSDILDPPPDHPSLTADSTNASFIYAIWDGSPSKHNRAGVFTRTTDGGATWESPRAIVTTDPQSYIQFSQILVQPNGTLVDIYQYNESQPKTTAPVKFTALKVLHSTDHGQTWSAPTTAVTMTPLYGPTEATLVVDPKTGQFVQDGTNPSSAVDSRNGNLYAVWGDGRFSSFQYNDIAFSVSEDGGFTWSTPIRVNQTPLNIPPLNRQAFLPMVAVAADGTIGVSYYDFRFNNSNPGVNTDYWLAQCHPSSAIPASAPACWGNEVRLTNSSFNIEAVLIGGSGDFFLGDYFGLAGTDHGFVSAFTAVDSQNITSIFARRVGQ